MRFLQYTTGLAMYQTKGTCQDIASLSGVSRDTMIRFLKADWSGQKRIEQILSSINMRGGYLILDDTPSAKPHSQTLEGLHYVYCSTLRKTVYGYCTVTLIWTNGTHRIPIGIRIWRKEKTKIQLALELLSYARNQLKLKPLFVLFDSWYAAKRILKRIDDYGWYFVTRLKKNRNFNGTSIEKVAWRKYFKGVGRLNGGIKVFVVKNANKFFATNRISLTRNDLLIIYSIRTLIEEFHRILKQEFCFCVCQVNSIEAQEHHRWCSIFAFTVIEVESSHLDMTVYKFRKLLNRKQAGFSFSFLDEPSDVA